MLITLTSYQQDRKGRAEERNGMQRKGRQGMCGEREAEKPGYISSNRRDMNNSLCHVNEQETRTHECKENGREVRGKEVREKISRQLERNSNQKMHYAENQFFVCIWNWGPG